MDVANEVRVEVYRSFVEDCRAPTKPEMAARLGISEDEVGAGLRELANQDVIAFVPGTEELWLAHPFCATDAPFEVTSGARRWESICVWDALGILALVETDGSVDTSCPDCGEDLRLEVAGGRVAASDGIVVHFGVPAKRWYEDVGYT